MAGLHNLNDEPLTIPHKVVNVHELIDVEGELVMLVTGLYLNDELPGCEPLEIPQKTGICQQYNRWFLVELNDRHHHSVNLLRF